MPSPIIQSWPEALMTAAAFLILTVYHLHLFYIVRKHPLATSLGITDHVRRRWILSVMENQRDTLAVRYYNHAGLMISIDIKHDSQLSPEIVTDVLNHGALHYTFGMREFYLAVPAALWLFGPVWMLGGAIALVVILYQLDREA